MLLRVNLLPILFCLMQKQAKQVQQEKSVSEGMHMLAAEAKPAGQRRWQGRGSVPGHQQRLLPGVDRGSCPHGVTPSERYRQV